MLYGCGQYTYELVDGWAKLPEGYSFCGDACGLAIDSRDQVYILNRSAHPIMVFDRGGKLLTSWGEGLFGRAHGAGIGPDGSIYCTDDTLHVVYKFTQEGKLLQTLGNKGEPSDSGYVKEWFDFFWSLTAITRGAPPFNRPLGVALSSSGEIYVADGYGNSRVHKFAPDGTLLLSWGEPGPAPGQFRTPHSIWVDRDDRVWVADRENNRIQIFNAQGKFLNQWDNLLRPQDIYIDDDGVVYVYELCLRMSIFSPDGKLLARWGNEGGEDKEKALFVAPHAIAIDSHGDLYTAEVGRYYHQIDRGPRTVQKFARRN